MLKLHTRDVELLSECTLDKRVIARITTNPHLPAALRDTHVLLVRPGTVPGEVIVPEGFLACFILEDDLGSLPPSFLNPKNFYKLPSHQAFMNDADVIKFDPSTCRLSFIYRKNSSYNALLVTERCNNYCLMCSQPPKDIDDSYIIDELLAAIPLMSRDTPEIGITGGEPTLLGPALPKLLRTLKGYLPSTSVHVLSNGRNFSNLKFTGTIAAVDHPDLMIGIPVYSDIADIHDYVVQADGAFDETIRGIINLKRYKQKVEIRVVIHKQTYARLPQLAEYIARNLTFVDHVALMGLEMMGFTRFNLEELWIDPIDYQPQLKAAVETLSRHRIRTSIYNHQLCLLDPSLWSYNTRSISDWKNEYMPECTPCTKRTKCGGFFSSAKLRYSNKINPFS